jgi:hypothetical protein
MNYSDDLILLEIAFIAGRPKETRLVLLKETERADRRRSGNIAGRPDDSALRVSSRELFIRSGAGAAGIHITDTLKEDN